MNELRQKIEQEIRERGPIPFSRYMEMCLYDTEFGYYHAAQVFGNLVARATENVPKRPGGDGFLTLLGLGFLNRGRRPGGSRVSRSPLEPLAVGGKCLLCNLVLSHCLFGIDFAKCFTRIALHFGDWLGWFKLARCRCHFFTLSPSYRRGWLVLELAHDLGVELELIHG